MARLFGLIGNRADLAGRVLGSEKDALSVHSRNGQLGWGIGFYQGGEVLMRRRPIDDHPWGRFVYFRDPDGNGWAVQEIPAGMKSTSRIAPPAHASSVSSDIERSRYDRRTPVSAAAGAIFQNPLSCVPNSAAKSASGFTLIESMP